MSISKLLKPLVNDKPGVEAGEWWKFEGIKNRFGLEIFLYLFLFAIEHVPLPCASRLPQQDTSSSSSFSDIDKTVVIQETPSNSDDTFEEQSNVNREFAAIPVSPPMTPRTDPTGASGTSGSSPAAPVTPHTYPNWLSDLKKQFRVLIIDKCNFRTRQAVDNNEKIKVR